MEVFMSLERIASEECGKKVLELSQVSMKKEKLEAEKLGIYLSKFYQEGKRKEKNGKRRWRLSGVKRSFYF